MSAHMSQPYVRMHPAIPGLVWLWVRSEPSTTTKMYDVPWSFCAKPGPLPASWMNELGSTICGFRQLTWSQYFLTFLPTVLEIGWWACDFWVCAASVFLDTASLAPLHVSAGDAAGCSKKGFIGINLPLQRMSFADSTCFHPEKTYGKLLMAWKLGIRIQALFVKLPQ